MVKQKYFYLRKNICFSQLYFFIFALSKIPINMLKPMLSIKILTKTTNPVKFGAYHPM